MDWTMKPQHTEDWSVLGTLTQGSQLTAKTKVAIFSIKFEQDTKSDAKMARL